MMQAIRRIVYILAILITIALGTQLVAQDTRDAELAHSDEELNKVYKAIMEQLSPADQPKLKAAQREWIKFRDLDCEWAFVDKRNCLMDRTNRRTEELKETFFTHSSGASESELLKAAPLSIETSDKIGMTIMLLEQGKDLKNDPALLREVVVKSFEKNGYSFSKTVQTIANDPINAQRNGMWAGFILAITSKLTEEQINNIYTEEEASAILNLREAMKAIGG